MLNLIPLIVRMITVKRLVIWILALIVAGFSFTAYEHRKELYSASVLGRVQESNTVVITKVFTLHQESANKIKDFVQADPNILGIAIMNADLRLNVRSLVFFYNRSQKDDLGIVVGRKIVTLPLFSRTQENNRQMVKLLNGEFDCSPYTPDLLSAALPEANPRTVAICQGSLPPYYGYFSGFVTIFLSVDPSLEYQIFLKSNLDLLSTEIYFKDIILSTPAVQYSK